MSYPPPPESSSRICPQAPYNSIVNPNYATNAQRDPNFPLNEGSNQSQIAYNNAANSYFEYINSTNTAIKATGTKTQPYVMFKTDRERLMYINGQNNAQSRVQAINAGTTIGRPPAYPTPTTSQLCNNVFSIINS